jgi:hypothetical protein
MIINERTVRSLDERIEKILTLHRLRVFEELGRSLKTTNCMESVLASVEQRMRKVDYWVNFRGKERWFSAYVLDIEPRLNKISGYKYLPLLRMAIKKEIKRREVVEEKERYFFLWREKKRFFVLIDIARKKKKS